MTRLFRLLLLAALIGPPVATSVVPAELLCSETRDCCAPDGACDVDCVACACCTGRTLTLTTTASVVPLHAPAGVPNSATASIRLPLRSIDILHVPKSA